MSVDCGLDNTNARLSENASKPDPRVRRTRDLIRGAMEALMAEKDFNAITVQHIAARADINRATFYDHFEDKFALLNYMVQHRFEEQVIGRLPDASTFTLDNLRLLTLATFDFLGDFVDHCFTPQGREIGAMTFIQVQTSLYQLVYDWVTTANPAAHAAGQPPETVALTASWVIFGAVLGWGRTRRERRPPAQEMVDQVLAVLLNGLGAYLSQSDGWTRQTWQGFKPSLERT